MRHIDFYIGDIHGRSDLLRKLIQFLSRHARTRDLAPRFTFLGDVIDRGPDSKTCVQMVFETLRNTPGSILIRGNHEDMMLDTIKSNGQCDASGNWALVGGRQCIESYAGSLNTEKFFKVIKEDYPHHIALLKSSSLYTQRGGLVAVHAGIDPTFTMENQPERVLLWARDSFLNYVSPDMTPVIHGHSVVGERPVITENRISIDTGANCNGHLTACIVDEANWEVSFAQSTQNTVRYVEPTRLDRGYGTLLDYLDRVFISQQALLKKQLQKPSGYTSN